MRRFTGILLCIFLLAGLCAPVAAREATGVETVTAWAYLLSRRADAVVVWVADADRLTGQAGDRVAEALEIPVSDATEFVGPDGQALQKEDLLPGQMINVMFYVTYEATAGAGGRGLRPVSCRRVVLLEDVLPVASTLDADDMRPGTGVGTVLTVERDERGRYTALLYIEAAGDDGARGRAVRVRLGDVDIYDTNRLRIMPENLPFFHRAGFSGDIGGNAVALEWLLLLETGEQVTATA